MDQLVYEAACDPNGSAASVHVRRRADSQDVLIAFSARAVPCGKFTFWKVLADLPINLVFVNDHCSTWYLEGTPDFASEQALLDHLAALCEPFRESGRVMTLGTSMGAYAALRYGAALGAERILAFGPESELCIPHGRSVTSLKGRSEGDESIAERAFRSPEQVLVVSGNADIVDFYCACKLKHHNPRISVALINNHSHVVAKYLDERVGLRVVAEEFFIRGTTSFLAAGQLGAHTTLDEATAIKQFNEALQRHIVRIDLETPIAKVAAEQPEWALLQYFHACVLEQRGLIESAENALERALRSAPLLGRARYKLAMLLISSGRPDEAIGHLETLSTQAHTLNVGNALARLYGEQGRHGPALTALEKNLRLALKPDQADRVREKICSLARTLLASHLITA